MKMNWDGKYMAEHSPRLEDLFVTRRQFLQRCGMGFGALSLAALLGESIADAAENNALSLNALAPHEPHFAGKAKRVIHIFAQGAPSHVDTFDPKPELTRFDGKSIPGGVAMGSPFKFQKYGRSGIEVSEVFPHLAE